MKKPAVYIKKVVMVLPLVAIISASFYPLQSWFQVLLIMLTLIWFNTFIFFDVLGK